MIGLLLISVAVFIRILSNPFANVFQKQLAIKGFDPLLVNFLTYLLLSILCIFLSFGSNLDELPGEFWLYSVLGGLSGAVGNGYLVKALKGGELSVLGPINAYKSIVGIIIGYFLLGEIPGVKGLLGMALIIGGSYFVLDTTDERFSWKLFNKQEIQFRIWALILTGIEAVFIKKVILTSTIQLGFISWCWFGSLFSFLFLMLGSGNSKLKIRSPSGTEIFQLLMLVVCVGLMQYSTTYVLANMRVGYALALFQLSIIVSVLLGYRFFKEKDMRKKLLGSIIMIGGSVLIVWNR